MHTTLQAHEMTINKDCKEAITKPNADYIKCVATFLPVCSNQSLKNLDAQLFPEVQSDGIDDILTLTCATRDAIKQAANIQAQTAKLASESHLTAQSQASRIVTYSQEKVYLLMYPKTS